MLFDQHNNQLANICEYPKCPQPGFMHAFRHLLKFLADLLISPCGRLFQISHLQHLLAHEDMMLV